MQVNTEWEEHTYVCIFSFPSHWKGFVVTYFQAPKLAPL
jgi:hypothetical protein